jgi:hypothetical protein
MATKETPTTLPADPPKPAILPKDPPRPGLVGDGEGYAGTKLSAAELVKKYGTNPDGSPATEPKPETPSCPPVSLSDGPFDTTAIPPGCSAPLSQECADFYNAQIKASESNAKGTVK